MKPALNCRSVIGTLILALVARSASAQAVSPIDYGTGRVADARLGIAIAAVAELTDTPALLGRPSSQSFVDDTFAQIAQNVPDPRLRSQADRRRAALRPGAGPFDRHAAYAVAVALEKDVLEAAGSAHDLCIAFGILAEQTDFNARVLRDAANDASDRAAIGKSDALDGDVAGLKDLRSHLAGLAREQWSDSADGANAIVAALLGSDFVTPFPKNSGVWLVLLRARGTDAGPRRRSLHYFIDIVRYDGTHETLGAYPNGTFAFERDADHLSCATDREGPSPSVRAIPVPPDRGSTSAQLADALIAGCTPERTKGLKYRVVTSDDDRFIADLLFRSGVDVAPILRAAAGGPGS